MVNFFNWGKLSEQLQAPARVLFPPLCRLCGDPGSTAIDLCPSCLASLPWNNSACPRCALPMHHEEWHCRCNHAVWNFASATIPLVYESPVAALISGFKYHGRLADGQLLGKILARQLKASGHHLPQCLIPLPLHSTRLRQRGFEQTAELARAICLEISNITIARILNRSRATLQQSQLAATQRYGNVRGVFAVNPKLPLPDHVALLDDVVTTGATVQSAAQELLHAGAKRVDLWAVARARIDY